MVAVDRRERQWSRALSRVAQQAHELEREIRDLREHEAHLKDEVRALERRVEEGARGGGPEHGPEAGKPGPVIHVYLVNGQDFYGIVNAMDDDSFSITLSNSAGRVLVIPKRNILYYRMKY